MYVQGGDQGLPPDDVEYVAEQIFVAVRGGPSRALKKAAEKTEVAQALNMIAIVLSPSDQEEAVSADHLLKSWVNEMMYKSPDGKLSRQPLAPVVMLDTGSDTRLKEGQLVFEAKEGNVHGVKRALAEGQSINTQHGWRQHSGGSWAEGPDWNEYKGLTAFFAAAVKGNWEVVRILAEQPGIDIMSAMYDTSFSCWICHGNQCETCTER